MNAFNDVAIIIFLDCFCCLLNDSTLLTRTHVVYVGKQFARYAQAADILVEIANNADQEVRVGLAIETPGDRNSNYISQC